MKFGIIFPLIRLWILFGVIKARKTSKTLLFSLSYVIHKFLSVESEFSTSSCMSFLRILKLIQLVSVIMITIHWNDQSINSVFIFQKLSQI